MKTQGVIIVGAGPAGIFTSLSLLKKGIKDIIILDMGKDIFSRNRKRGRGGELLSGWGGAGAFSDGKLTFSSEVGGFLSEFVSHKKLVSLLHEADKIYLTYGGTSFMYGEVPSEIEGVKRLAKLAGMEFIPMQIRHLGTENCQSILKNIRKSLEDKLVIRTETKVENILVEKKRVKGVKLKDGEIIKGRFVVSAPGRVGSGWMQKEAIRLKLTSIPSPVDIGVRVELPAAVLQRITDATYEPKLIYYSKSFDDRVRIFCMNPYGEVVTEEVDGIITVNGHSYANKKTDNSNFAVLVSSTFTEPFDNPIGYGKYIAKLANLLGKGVIVQRLGDLLEGRRSTQQRIDKCITRPTLKCAIPGDLSFVLPYRYLKGIIEMLEAMDHIAPGIYSRHTLIYGVEVKFYSHRISLSKKLESEIDNLFVIGDGAGVTRGLLQASVCGMIAGEEIAKRLLN
ncbi:MAG: FAD-dependent oxidoreductase [Deltaproteobacteria bacterium DG_8]|nr:MAG: FAD-dependent oxidoreductase [Deltaproteobacteria bacterium DG_8]